MNDPDTTLALAAAKLSVVHALIGEITPCMRAITIENAPGRLKVWVYTDRPTSPDEEEEFDARVMTQVVSDFPDEVTSGKTIIGFEFVIVPPPAKVAIQGHFLFMRRE